MSYRVHIEDIWTADRLGVHIGRNQAGEWTVAQPTDVVLVPAEPGVATPAALEIPHDLARALYEALARHFHGDALTVDMRKALDIERARLDKFIELSTSVTYLTSIQEWTSE